LEECLPDTLLSKLPFHNCQKWSAHPLSNRMNFAHIWCTKPNKFILKLNWIPCKIRIYPRN
jgi:hypothetical protein